MKTTNRRNLFILVFALLVVMLGFGMVIPVFPYLIDKLGASGSTLGILVATAALTEFLFGPIWGSISDRVGRKPILMIGMRLPDGEVRQHLGRGRHPCRFRLFPVYRRAGDCMVDFRRMN
jgi:hypothetical protein